MGLIRQALKAGLATVLSPRFLLTQGPRDCGALALTFDDGPHPEHTPRLLDVLREYHLQATFFVIGSQAAKHPEIVRRIVAEGHDLGNHTYSHSDPARTSAAELIDEVRRWRSLLEEITGTAPHLFRPPHGKLFVYKTFRLWTERQTIVLWNIDPRDFAMTSRQAMEGWCDQYQPQAGDVVLLHDNHPHAARAVPLLAARAAAQGLGFRRISEWTPSVQRNRERDHFAVGRASQPVRTPTDGLPIGPKTDGRIENPSYKDGRPGKAVLQPHEREEAGA